MAERTLEKPLLEEDYTELKARLADTAKIETALNKAKTAGIDIQNGLEENRKNRQKIQSLLNTYFPGR